MPIKKIAAMLLVIVLLISGTMPAYADGIDSIIPPINIDGVTTVEADVHSISAYTFDTEKMKMTDVIPAALNALSNIFFFLNVLVSKVVNSILVQAFQLDIFEYIEVIFDDLIFGLRDAIYKPLIGVVIPITGISILFFAVVNKTTRALSLFFQSIIILVVAAIFMSAPSLVISMVNDVSQDLAGSSLSATATIVNGRNVSGNDAVASLSNIYWGNAVKNPWQLIQFGELDTQRAEEYLVEDKDKRTEMAASESDTIFKKDYQWLRFVLVIFFSVLNAIQSGLILLLAGIMVLTQFAAIVAAITAVLGFAISLLPNQGLRVAIHAVYNIFTFLLTRIGIMLLLCVYFAIATVLYRNISTAGWFFTMILQVLLILAIIIYRNKIFSFVKSATHGAQASISAINEKSSFGKDMRYMRNAVLTGYGGAKIIGDVQSFRQRRQTRKLEEKYEPTAEKYLYKRYEEEKAYAEKEAEENKKPVQYSEFVRKTDARVERGITPFSVDDLKKTTGMMVNIHKQGEDPDRLVMTKVSGKTDHEIRNDQRSLESRLNKTKDEMKVKEDANENTINRVIRTDKQSEFYEKRRAIVEGVKGKFGKEQESLYYNVLNEPVEVKTAQEAQISKQTADGTTPAAVSEEIKAKVETSGASGSEKNQPILREATTTNESVTSKDEVVKNVSEINNIQRTEERKETEQKNVSTTSNEVVKTHQENVENRTETVDVTKQNDVQSVVNEKKDFINVETSTETQTKNVNQSMINVQNNTLEKNEVVNEKVVNTANVKEVENTTRNQERTNRIESDQSSNRRELFNKLDRLDKKNNNNE